MQVDTTVLCQGIINARTKNDISPEYAEAIFEAVKRIAYVGDTGRMVCDYEKMSILLAGLEAEWLFCGNITGGIAWPLIVNPGGNNA